MKRIVCKLIGHRYVSFSSWLAIPEVWFCYRCRHITGQRPKDVPDTPRVNKVLFERATVEEVMAGTDDTKHHQNGVVIRVVQAGSGG
jgi:hypothetical protein